MGGSAAYPIGHVVLKEPAGATGDTLDFSNFQGGGINVNLNLTGEQVVSPGDLWLTLPAGGTPSRTSSAAPRPTRSSATAPATPPGQRGGRPRPVRAAGRPAGERPGPVGLARLHVAHADADPRRDRTRIYAPTRRPTSTAVLNGLVRRLRRRSPGSSSSTVGRGDPGEYPVRHGLLQRHADRQRPALAGRLLQRGRLRQPEPVDDRAGRRQRLPRDVTGPGARHRRRLRQPLDDGRRARGRAHAGPGTHGRVRPDRVRDRGPARRGRLPPGLRRPARRVHHAGRHHRLAGLGRLDPRRRRLGPGAVRRPRRDHPGVHHRRDHRRHLRRHPAEPATTCPQPTVARRRSSPARPSPRPSPRSLSACTP